MWMRLEARPKQFLKGCAHFYRKNKVDSQQNVRSGLIIKCYHNVCNFLQHTHEYRARCLELKTTQQNVCFFLPRSLEGKTQQRGLNFTEDNKQTSLTQLRVMKQTRRLALEKRFSGGKACEGPCTGGMSEAFRISRCISVLSNTVRADYTDLREFIRPRPLPPAP